MPQTYKGASIPAYSDTADGPLAFRTLVDGGSVVSRVASSAKPAAPVEGHVIWNTTDKRFEYWNGSAWTVLARGDGGPRGFVAEFTATSQTIANAAGWQNASTVTVTGLSVGRRLKYTVQHTASCGATTDPEIEFAVNRPNSTADPTRNWILKGAGQFRVNTMHSGVWTTTSASQIFALVGRVRNGNNWVFESGYWIFEDLGPA
jgi:hypothetical protein